MPNIFDQLLSVLSTHRLGIMSQEAELPAVERYAMLNSAARLIWLSNSAEDNLKRSVALYLINTQAKDSDLPPHAPLAKLADMSGLKAAPLRRVLEGDSVFGVLAAPGPSGAEADATSVVYLNAETLITRVYKEPGQFSSKQVSAEASSGM